MLSSLRGSVRSKEVLYLCKAMAIALLGRTRCGTDVLEAIVSTMRSKRLLPPVPIVFADSNWVKDFFAFMVSPISQEIELWSVNAYGTEGQPIQSWKMWLNGSRRDRTWGVLTNPSQYRSFQADVMRKKYPSF
jgi:hypothetical protein